MNKRTPLLIATGILLAGFLIGIKLMHSVIVSRKAERALIEKELEARFSQMDRQIKDLSMEKSQLTQREADLESNLKLLQEEIRARTEKEAALNKRAEELAEEKQNLSTALAETTESMQKKLRMTAAEAEQEIERRREEYIAAEKDSLVEVTVLRKELEKLHSEKTELMQMTEELVEELHQTRQDMAYAPLQVYVQAPFSQGSEHAAEALSLEEPPPPEELFKHYYNQALEHDNMGEYPRALEEYQKALDLMPRDPDLHYNMAVIYDDHVNNKEKAVFHYQRYLVLNPKSPDRVKVETWLTRAIEDLKWQKKLN
jgi:tetratricopeptide (TPR) repeat protein